MHVNVAVLSFKCKLIYTAADVANEQRYHKIVVSFLRVLRSGPMKICYNYTY